ncbi:MULTISPECIES: hypothetical protein [unclassified Streptomyces]|uniref:hypothetical protein n=1 Tax=unclassified Streptomyces TaxID=2593676 RepID=UPI002E2E6C0A|nr:hypothetical protein [Streptomyces sp. NBC_01439]
MGPSRTYQLSLTTQGPAYPPSEVMDENGDFVVIGRINRDDGAGGVSNGWGCAIVAADSPLPEFGKNEPYRIVRELPDHPGQFSPADNAIVLHTLPLPLPCSNYPMVFAPEQFPDASEVVRPSYPFHQVAVPDLRAQDGPKVTEPVTLGTWGRARGELEVRLSDDRKSGEFGFEFSGMLPNSLYTVMSLREHDLDPAGPTRPGPLGVPNAFVTDQDGRGRYRAVLPDPFPAPGTGGNRIVNVVVLWMSYQQNYGGAIGQFGLGGDIHAQLKLQGPSFGEFITTG